MGKRRPRLSFVRRARCPPQSSSPRSQPAHAVTGVPPGEDIIWGAPRPPRLRRGCHLPSRFLSGRWGDPAAAPPPVTVPTPRSRAHLSSSRSLRAPPSRAGPAPARLPEAALELEDSGLQHAPCVAGTQRPSTRHREGPAPQGSGRSAALRGPRGRQGGKEQRARGTEHRARAQQRKKEEGGRGHEEARGGRRLSRAPGVTSAPPVLRHARAPGGGSPWPPAPGLLWRRSQAGRRCVSGSPPTLALCAHILAVGSASGASNLRRAPGGVSGLPRCAARRRSRSPHSRPEWFSKMCRIIKNCSHSGENARPGVAADQL